MNRAELRTLSHVIAEQLCRAEMEALAQEVLDARSCHEPGCVCPYLHSFHTACNKCGHAPKPMPEDPSKNDPEEILP